MIETILNDLRYGAKMLWKSKGVTIVAVVSLAIGIGANSAIFSLVNSILLRPRPVSHPGTTRRALRRRRRTTLSHHFLSKLSRSARSQRGALSGLAAYGIQQFKLGDVERGRADLGRSSIWKLFRRVRCRRAQGPHVSQPKKMLCRAGIRLL